MRIKAEFEAALSQLDEMRKQLSNARTENLESIHVHEAATTVARPSLKVLGGVGGSLMVIGLLLVILAVIKGGRDEKKPNSP